MAIGKKEQYIIDLKRVKKKYEKIITDFSDYLGISSNLRKEN